MILKPHKPTLITELIVESILMMFWGIFFFLDLGELFPFVLITALYTLLHLIKMSFIFDRTININPEGCTVKFLFYKKQYAWSDFKTIRVENYSLRLNFGGAGNIYEKAIIFSTRENFHTPEWLNISSYLTFCINPFHFFPVFFEEYRKGEFRYYEVKEQPFMELLQEYGVEVLK